MKLGQHPDFGELVIQTTAHLGVSGLTEQLIEKDYWVTEVLRAVAEHLPTQTIFKGGTSLSKGWNLIERFSEDVDLFVDPQRFNPPLGKNAIDRELRKLRDHVATSSGLLLIRPNPTSPIGGFGRSDHFLYRRRFDGIAAVRDEVLLESGTASGREPVVTIDIESYVAKFLRETESSIGADDESAFPMRVMHFRRTFVEKMFAIHAKVEIYKSSGVPIESYARHYYDLHCLLQQGEVTAMLQTPEYDAIKLDYKHVSEEFFPRNYLEPPGMSFASSEALFPPSELIKPLQRDYEVQCRNLCYGPYPAFEQVLEGFAANRGLL